MKYIALLLAYVSIMVNVSYYHQLDENGFDISIMAIWPFIIFPLVFLMLSLLVAVVVISVGMHYQWWKKPDIL